MSMKLSMTYEYDTPHHYTYNRLSLTISLSDIKEHNGKQLFRLHFREQKSIPAGV